MKRRTPGRLMSCLVLAVLACGCRSPYHSDQGALAGGLLGAGTGALLGSAVGKAGAGAAIGAGVGALTGAAVGSEMDNIEARNRAMIEQQMGRQIAAAAVTRDDVVAMTRAGVAEELIINHVRAHGVAVLPSAGDIIFLQQQGVSPRVIAAMQEPPRQPQPMVIQQPGPPPVIVQEYDPYWGPPWRYRPYRPYYGPRPGVSLSFHN